MNQPINSITSPGADTVQSTPASNLAAKPLPIAASSPVAWIRFLLIAGGGLTADLWTKHLAFAELGYGPGSRRVILIPDVLQLRTTLNPGAVFGVGPGLAPLFILISLVAIGFVVYVFMNTQRQQWVIHTALGLILAGAMGNLYDRAFNHGQVRDFILLHYWPWIFNLADAMLCIGVPLLIVCWLLQGAQMSAPPKVR
ncbi:MAG: signal peptidase II [Planctomycetes bacterium]|jgi:signal peptidase II|nr:signal peptidase II [Planctomycetota bacterium]